MNTYGLFGYAVYSHVTSDYIEFYPPNNPPEISGSDPADGQTDVPVALSELRFRLADADGDLMSYNVTTIPDIGSGSGGLKPDGVYSLPVSGLKELTKYSWTVSVSDGKDTTTQTYSFTTEGVSPIVSNPRPFDGEKEVQTDLTELRFTLQDPQHDFMSYTVQTSPDIGSASATNVAGGTYTVPVNGLTIGTLYHWYINATDGTHWTRMVLSFTSGYPSHFNPYDYGWQYRKQITIDHTKVTEPLTNFTVLISITDSDLTKAQSDGGDILFMDNTGSAVKIHHEIHVFDSSTGTLAAWVQVPELSSTTDTVFYMYYGNPTCVDQAYPQETWDSSYLAVWHMGDATTSTITDSTNNDNTGTKGVVNGPTEQGGVTGTSQDFDGTDDYIQFTTPIIPTGPKTVTGWIKRHTTADYGVVLATSTGISSLDRGTAWTMIPGNDKKMQCFLGNDEYGSHYMTVYITIPDLTNWHYYAMTYDGTTLQMYLDGSSDVSTTTKVGSETPPDYNLRMGKTNHPSYVYPLDGTLDDITISDVPRSIGWVQTSYQTMSDPAHFFTEGPEEHGP